MIVLHWTLFSCSKDEMKIALKPVKSRRLNAPSTTRESELTDNNSAVIKEVYVNDKVTINLITISIVDQFPMNCWKMH